MQDNDNGYNLVTSKQGRVFSLFVRQPFTTELAMGRKTIEIRSHRTKIRGDILLCSTQTYDYDNAQGGCSVGILHLLEIKSVSELTDKEWEQTRIPKTKRSRITKGWAWIFTNPRRVIEYPVRSKNKIAYIKFNLDDIFIYPKYVVLDKLVGMDKVNKFLNNNDGS